MMGTIIDFHSHILPEIDDGSRSPSGSIDMLYMEQAQGISRVVATPHFYAHRDDLDSFLERRSYAEQQLREEMTKHSDLLPKLLVGAEVSYFPGMSNSDAISKLVIGDSRCILIEMPFLRWTDGMFSELQNIHDMQGLTPIIAHIDRYINRFNYRGILQRLDELPVVVQGNAEAFLERHTAPLVFRMLKKGQIHMLGSDCHNVCSRPPNLGNALQAIRKRIGEKELEDFLRCGEGILEGNVNH